MSRPLWEMRLRLPLDKFELDVHCTSERRVIGLFGPSGSGKTTWLETVAGLRRHARGYLRCGESVWLDSEAGIRLRAEQRGIGYVPQDHLLFPHLSVRQNLESGARRARREGHDFAAIFAEVVEVLELAPLLGRKPGGLSGGERQRVALGRALCSGPRMLMLDEPLASLDAELRHRILPFLLRVRDHFDIPIFVVSHNPLELQALCDEVIALRAGKIVFQGPPIEVFTRSDIYPTAAGDGFENILPATVATHHAHSTQIVLGAGAEGPCASLVKLAQPAGAAILVGIRANDILVATQPISGLSARNCLPATVESIQAVDSKVLLTARLRQAEAPEIVVELTHDALTDLNLSEGSAIHLVMKSNAFSVYD